MLQIKHISKQYQTGELVQQALDDVSLNLRDSEFVAILGPSGSGKTTLLNIIGGLDRYDSGDLIINGVSTKEYGDRNWDTYRNHSIGFVFQSYNLIQHQTVLSNVELALTIAGLSARERRERAVKTLEQVGLGNQLHKKPNQMSGGQMQRVALARALVNDPDILLADEPTGALDSETSRQVMDLMKQVAKDRLVVMVTHNPELAEEYASRIVRVKDGRIIDDTRPFSDEAVAAASLEGAAGAAKAAASGEGVSGNETFRLSEEPEEAAPSSGDAEERSRKKHASMSFLTSLALSFSNLRTKKGRTILTSFAGSIGIIGIALILSLSNGVNDYIAKIQRDTMASYPITVSSTSLNFSAFMSGDGSAFQQDGAEEKAPEAGKVSASFRDLKVSSSVSGSIHENNLTAFKQYLDDKNSEIRRYIGEHGVVYTYNVDFKVYSHDRNGALVDTDADVTSEFSDENNILGNLLEARSLMMSNMSTMFGGGRSQNGANFSEMMAGANGEAVSHIIRDNYDVIYGAWPERYDEVVLVLNGNQTLTSGVLYQLGLIPKEEYRKAVRVVERDEEPEPVSFDYREICDHEFLLLTSSDQYRKNKNGTFSRIDASEKQIEEALKGAVRLHISGIVMEKEDADIQSLGTPIAYTTMLTDYMIRHGNESDIVKAQQAKPDTDVLTGQKFMEEEPSDKVKASRAEDYLKHLSRAEQAELFSTLMMIDYEGGMEAVMTTQMQALSDQIGPRLQQALSEAVGGVIEQAVREMMTQLQSQIQSVVASAMEQSVKQVMDQAMQQVMKKVMPRVMESLMKEVMGQVMKEVLPQLMNEVFPQLMQDMMQQMMEKAVPQIIEQVYQKALMENVQMVVETLRDQLSEGALPKELEPFLSVTSWEEFTQLIEQTDFSAVDFGNVDLSKIDLSGLEFNTFDLSDLDLSSLGLEEPDFSKIRLKDLDLSKLDPGKIDLSKVNLDDLDFSDLDIKELDLKGLDFSQLDLGSLDLSSMDFSGLDLSGLGSAFEGLSLSMGEEDMAQVVRYWLENLSNQKKLALVFDRFIGVSDYDTNLKNFGMISYDAPSSISLYADSFEAKDGIAASIQHYNESAEKEDQITYTDYVALLTTSITTIIDAISYVLIGFVAVSLFVSCIMIGVITNISVLERTKEIGVLRALGASKRNISNVFNAETFIIGCLSGLIGVGISLLLILPINAVVHSLMESDVLSAQLPPLSAAILVAISIAITMIGGLIPASKAAKKDPVEALRSE